jgi:hypothetical protein
MHRTSRFALHAALAVAPTVTLLAQQPRDTARVDSIPPRLLEIVVEGRKPLATIGGSSVIQLRIESLSLPTAPSLDQVLRTLPMLHVRRNSRGETEISARGSESRQVAAARWGAPRLPGTPGRIFRDARIGSPEIESASGAVVDVIWAQRPRGITSSVSVIHPDARGRPHRSRRVRSRRWIRHTACRCAVPGAGDWLIRARQNTAITWSSRAACRSQCRR